jgi:hypothetical protein
LASPAYSSCMVVLWMPMEWKNSFTCLATIMWWFTVLHNSVRIFRWWFEKMKFYAGGWPMIGRGQIVCLKTFWTKVELLFSTFHTQNTSLIFQRQIVSVDLHFLQNFFFLWCKTFISVIRLDSSILKKNLKYWINLSQPRRSHEWFSYCIGQWDVFHYLNWMLLFVKKNIWTINAFVVNNSFIEFHDIFPQNMTRTVHVFKPDIRCRRFHFQMTAGHHAAGIRTINYYAHFVKKSSSFFKKMYTVDQIWYLKSGRN